MGENRGLQQQRDKEFISVPKDSFLTKALFRFIEVLVLPLIAFFLHFVVLEADKIWAIAAVASFLLLCGAYVLLIERRNYNRREQLKNQLETKGRERKLLEANKLISSTRKGELFSAATQKVSQGLRDVGILSLGLANRPIFHDSSKWAADKKWKTLSDLCETLRHDNKEYKGLSDYFKATLFRVESNNVLQLDACFYPPGDFPRTEKIERQHQPHATAFRCLDERTMQIIPDVPIEAKQGAKAKWVEFYEGQAEHYGSMLCTPITIGERSAHTHKVVAILTIDTNRIDYFSTQEEDKALIGYFLVPFRYYLSFIYLATTDIS